uniref:PSI domain-containing protein n=1 Tax=Mola mola TaxID=94237 RepID=A0A3Q3VR56_MOLML
SSLLAMSPSVLFAWIVPGLLLAAEAQTAAPYPCALRSNTSCDECLKNVTCLWCEPTSQCVDYPAGNILPPSSLCPLNDARWGVCWVNFQILIITMAVLAGVLIVSILVCCFCCCKCERIGLALFSAVYHFVCFSPNRRTEMQLRHDEIRQKYGLAKKNPYARMDDQ